MVRAGRKGSGVELARWLPAAVGAVGAVTGAALVMRRRGAKQGSPPPDPFSNWVIRFQLSHQALRRNLDRFIDLADRGQTLDARAFGDFVDLYSRFLEVHHESEDRVVFPTLRRHGRLRSTDAAHLDRWGAEHRDVNALGQALAKASGTLRSGGRDALLAVRRLSEELRAILEPHLSGEEALLTASHLAEMVPASAIGEIERASQKLFGSNRALPLFFAHSLSTDEQRQVFGAAPWVFRRVILRLMDRRVFPRLKPFAITPSLAT